MSNSFSPISGVYRANSPRHSLALPRRLDRTIAAQWKWWAPWVRMHLIRLHDYDMAAVALETARLRQRHSDHIIAFTDAGVPMRLVRKHRLDDPRITDEVRAVLVQTTRERQRKAWRVRRHQCDWMAQLWGDNIRNRPLSLESPHNSSPNSWDIIRSRQGAITIDSIKKHVSEHFHLREMGDPNLQVRTHRHVFVLARQIAMYIVRQATGASLQEIGREFGGRHHSTVLHSIRKIEQMRRTDEQVSRTIRQLVYGVQGAEAVVTRTCNGVHGRLRRMAKRVCRLINLIDCLHCNSIR